MDTLFPSTSLFRAIGGAVLALRKPADRDRQVKLISGIRDTAQRGAGLIKQLLAFSRRQPLEATLIDTGKQVAEAADLLRHSISPEIELILEISDHLSPIEIDSAQLEMALLNLGLNARDAMPHGGTIRITARNVTLDDENDKLHGPFVALSVSDTGIGMAPETLDRIFEPFFTTKRIGDGTGLGLSRVYGFAQQSNGRSEEHTSELQSL